MTRPANEGPDEAERRDCPRCEHPTGVHYLSADGRQVFCHQCDCNDLSALESELLTLRAEVESSRKWRRCDTHGDIDGASQWGCPECVSSLRESNRRLREAARVYLDNTDNHGDNCAWLHASLERRPTTACDCGYAALDAALDGKG